MGNQIVAPRQWTKQTDTTAESPAVTELREMNARLARIERLFDDFARVFLNARFTGQGTDRWARRR